MTHLSLMPGRSDGERTLRLSPKAAKGRDCCRQIREQINRLRAQGCEPKTVFVGKDMADFMHQMWTEIAAKYDKVLPKLIGGVPFKVGSGLGRTNFQFEYWPPGDNRRNALRRNVVSNPLPDNA